MGKEALKIFSPWASLSLGPMHMYSSHIHNPLYKKDIVAIIGRITTRLSSHCKYFINIVCRGASEADNAKMTIAANLEFSNPRINCRYSPS